MIYGDSLSSISLMNSYAGGEGGVDFSIQSSMHMAHGEMEL